jgi:acyl dehydratase
MTEVKRPALLKANLDTPFHIDFDWWQQNENDWHVHMRSVLCETHQQMFAETENDQQIDWIDPETAEVRPLDGLQHVLMSHCAKQEEFLTINTALVDGVFRVLLSRGNAPQSPRQLAEVLGKSPEVILKTIAGPRVYKGIRPKFN